MDVVQTYRMTIEYDGTDFHGWQVQPNLPSVQAALETALQTVLRTPVNVVGSGRTDAGVHARRQVAHFQTGVPVDLFRLRASLNGLLPPSVTVTALETTAQGFHARYDARLRRYHYYLSTQPRALERHLRWYLRPAPDFDAMNTAAAALLGRHNFSAFCHTRSETKNRICTIRSACFMPEDRPHDWMFVIEADRFLHGMVRAIVGTLLEIGRGRRPLNDLPRILASGDRREAGPAAPAHGLVLEQVTYLEEQ